ncbi:MAG: 50S ribosomal protein L9 [Anaerolineales bacterium]
MLLKDVYKLGRAGDVKKVADGYGRNYLLPQGLAVLATAGALKQSDRIRTAAGAERARLNEELGALSEKLAGLTLSFPARAGETGKLYGSVTTAQIAEAIQAASGAQLDKRQIDSQPIKILGVHPVKVRLTVDLVPEITVLVHREGEAPESAYEIEKAAAERAEAFAELQKALEAEEAEEKEEEAGTSEPAGEET